MREGNCRRCRRNHRNRSQRLTKSAKRLLFIVCLFFVLLTGCDDFLLYIELDGISEGPFAISPRDISLPIGEEYTFSASGGYPPYTYSIFLGSGSIGESTGVYTAPGLDGYDIIQVTDLAGNASDASVAIYTAGGLSIIPNYIEIVKNESCSFTASGGTGSYSYSVESGTGTINASTGFFTAPDKVETGTVMVTDLIMPPPNTADATVKIRPN
ncbi:hypothetical protein ES703_62060 [subsurface metagenome]